MNSLDEAIEVRGVFLDITEAYDKVRHKRLIYKLPQSRISGELFNIQIDFLNNSKQRVVLNGHTSNRVEVIAQGIPQGSIIGPLFILISISDLSESLNTNANFLADNKLLFWSLIVWDIAAGTKELSNNSPGELGLNLE